MAQHRTERGRHRAGRHRRGPRPAVRRKSATSSLVVASAVAVTGIGAISGGTTLSLAAASVHSPMPGSAHRDGMATISRSTTRPAAHDAAVAAADRRDRVLRAVVHHARSYAARLDQRHWLPPTTRFQITEWFGDPGWLWSTGYHTGVDFATSCGTPVVAVTDATIARSGWDGSYGNQVRLQLEDGDQLWYNHLNLISVHAGEPVRRGQQLGLVGETGNAYGCHLHLEYRVAGDLKQPVDPVPYLARHGIHLR